MAPVMTSRRRDEIKVSSIPRFVVATSLLYTGDAIGVRPDKDNR
jgi:hypothetical protein